MYVLSIYIKNEMSVYMCVYVCMYSICMHLWMDGCMIYVYMDIYPFIPYGYLYLYMYVCKD